MWKDKPRYHGANAANGPPARHRRPGRKNQVQRANQNGSKENSQPGAKIETEMPCLHSGAATVRPETTKLPPIPEVVWQQPQESHLIDIHKNSKSNIERKNDVESQTSPKRKTSSRVSGSDTESLPGKQTRSTPVQWLQETTTWNPTKWNWHDNLWQWRWQQFPSGQPHLNLILEIRRLRFKRHNSVVIDTTHGFVQFPHLIMQVKSASSGASAKPQVVLIHDNITVPPMTAEKITAFVDHLWEWNTTGTVTPVEKFAEAASRIISQSISTIIDRKIAVRVTNTAESPYTTTRIKQIADFSVVTPEQPKFIKKVDTASLNMIPEADLDLTTYLTELLKTNQPDQQNNTFLFPTPKKPGKKKLAITLTSAAKIIVIFWHKRTMLDVRKYALFVVKKMEASVVYLGFRKRLDCANHDILMMLMEPNVITSINLIWA